MEEGWYPYFKAIQSGADTEVIINGEKMAKSLGNFYTLRDIMNAGISPRVTRYFLLSAHYRQPLNLIYDPQSGTQGSFDATQAASDRIDEFRIKLNDLKQHAAAGDMISRKATQLLENSRAAFDDALANDLDISGALGALFSLIKESNRLIDSGELSAMDAEAIDKRLLKWDKVLDIMQPDRTEEIDAEHIEALITERNEARKNKDFGRADQIREQLASEGIILQDVPEGTRWRRR